MAYENKELQGSLFRNDKGNNEKRPDYKGDALIGGIKYNISAWIRESKSGKKFMSLNFQPDGEERKPAPKPKQEPKKQEVLEDDLPF